MSDREDTRIQEVPPDETGPVPVTMVEAEPRWYGITPRDGVLAVGLAAVGVGIVLVVLGSWIAGVVLIVLGVAALAMLVRGLVARSLAGPAGVGRTAVSVRLSTGRALAARRRELDDLARERDRRLRELGEAVYRGDGEATDSLRQRLEELDRLTAERRDEMERMVAEASERLRAARLETSRTEVVSLEPWPPPDEGDVPQHPDIPEPYPPPDEGDRPEQPRVPETEPEPPEQRPG